MAARQYDQPYFTPPAPLSRPAYAKRKRLQHSEAEIEEPRGVHSRRSQRSSPLRVAKEASQRHPIAEVGKLKDVHHSVEPRKPLCQISSAQPSPTSQPIGVKRERLQDSEADRLHSSRPSQQPQKLPPSKSPEEISRKDPEPKADEQELAGLANRLTEKNLRLFNEEMDEVASSSRSRSFKRTSSQQSSVTPSEVGSSQSQHSSSTAAHYRYEHLNHASIYIHVDPPEDIQAAIDNIVGAELSDNRLVVIREKANEYWKTCKDMVRAAVGEDDFVHAFKSIAQDMGPENLLFREKAEWREELKPAVQQSDANLTFLNTVCNDEQQEADHALTPPPPKRRKRFAGRAHISPKICSNQSSAPSSNNKSTVPNEDRRISLIKTPRSDITIGIRESALTSTLASSLALHSFNYITAKKFLEELQNTAMPSEQDGPPELALIIVPTKRKSGLAFPSLVVEGKGYSTGKQVFGAQNQAAVSGACGIKMQMMLNALVQRASDPLIPGTRPDDQLPLMFSIEGS